MKKRIVLLVAILIAILASYASAAKVADHPIAWIDALAIKESDNTPHKPYWDVNAWRLGYFAISENYWGDAVEFDKSLDAKHGGSWERCEKDRDYAAKVVMAYMRRYCPTAVKNNDWETMSRVHNGGPGGVKNK